MATVWSIRERSLPRNYDRVRMTVTTGLVVQVEAIRTSSRGSSDMHDRSTSDDLIATLDSISHGKRFMQVLLAWIIAVRLETTKPGTRHPKPAKQSFHSLATDLMAVATQRKKLSTTSLFWRPRLSSKNIQDI